MIAVLILSHSNVATISHCNKQNEVPVLSLRLYKTVGVSTTFSRFLDVTFRLPFEHFGQGIGPSHLFCFYRLTHKKH
jgi:hypothetical protein